MKYITVKQLYEKLNAEHPGLIGINSVYELVKRSAQAFFCKPNVTQ